ncbi:PocR ligand-binding domain-containing protein [Methanolobus sp.]|jgi:ligand-binding sensor protein|uniref:PocR ligand-binding domain-containing protein n=1 Tax=Methanolobus sp. TaxID=1874737 RepID=UPI0025EC84E1|nr:PocR ligand-binding domain-containing protein [Methanolobus sp.]
MEYKFTDLVNIDKFQELMVSFDIIPDISFSIVDSDVSILASSGQTVICSGFHGVKPVKGNKCPKSNGSIVHFGETKRDCYEYKCDGGLASIELPIFVEDNYLATAIFGQLFFKKPYI